jgi:hypothetical protein
MWSQAVPSGCYVKKKFCDGGHLGYPIDEKHIFFDGLAWYITSMSSKNIVMDNFRCIFFLGYGQHTIKSYLQNRFRIV